jgi:YggT family protein
MNPLVSAGIYLIQIAVIFYVPLVLLRFLLQSVRADFYNPLSQFIVRVTNPLLRPLRRLIPGVFGLDVASLILALFIQWLALILMIGLLGQLALVNIGLLGLWAATGLLAILFKMYFAAIILLVIVSWIAPYSNNPLIVLSYQLTEPVMRRLRHILPPMGGLDFSPMIVIIGIGLLDRLVLTPLMMLLGIPDGLMLGL